MPFRAVPTGNGKTRQSIRFGSSIGPPRGVHRTQSQQVSLVEEQQPAPATLCESFDLKAQPTPSVPCRYFAMGCCRNGDSCPFYHAPSLCPAVRGADDGGRVKEVSVYFSGFPKGTSAKWFESEAAVCGGPVIKVHLLPVPSGSLGNLSGFVHVGSLQTAHRLVAALSSNSFHGGSPQAKVQRIWREDPKPKPPERPAAETEAEEGGPPPGEREFSDAAQIAADEALARMLVDKEEAGWRAEEERRSASGEQPPQGEWTLVKERKRRPSVSAPDSAPGSRPSPRDLALERCLAAQIAADGALAASLSAHFKKEDAALLRLEEAERKTAQGDGATPSSDAEAWTLVAERKRRAPSSACISRALFTDDKREPTRAQIAADEDESPTTRPSKEQGARSPGAGFVLLRGTPSPAPPRSAWKQGQKTIASPVTVMATFVDLPAAKGEMLCPLPSRAVEAKTVVEAQEEEYDSEGEAEEAGIAHPTAEAWATSMDVRLIARA